MKNIPISLVLSLYVMVIYNYAGIVERKIEFIDKSSCEEYPKVDEKWGVKYVEDPEKTTERPHVLERLRYYDGAPLADIPGKKMELLLWTVQTGHRSMEWLCLPSSAI